MRRIIAAFLLLIPVSATAQKKILILETYRKNDSTKTYKQILITGEGNMQSKMYLQNISAELTEALKEKNIECHYEYLGDNHKVDVEAAYEKAITGKYDVVLRAIPRSTDEALYQKNSSYRDPVTGIATYDPTPIHQNGALRLKTLLTNDFDFSLI